MNSAERDALQSWTDGMRGRVDQMTDVYERQLEQFGAAKSELANLTVQGWSQDQLVRVTANSAGIPLDVWVAPEAFKRSNPERLGAAMTEAAQAAARAAKEQLDARLAPVLAAVSEVGLPEDPFGELPTIARPDGNILPPPPPEPETEPQIEFPRRLDEDPDDEGPHWKGW
ncbi:YbaB/EbfC family nucleoid-associated protein [Nocardia pseudovaccinii]|uniref:YbaB/EbfC family nucleoid-associated protein n=1 Tax=Nocardia pseudovaccinii TaxID=189540 RepID=UPI0007A5222B|nr:YbaB/EbfC family nucleoid-associated protein [Nocardia pseudovaccinii]